MKAKLEIIADNKDIYIETKVGWMWCNCIQIPSYLFIYMVLLEYSSTNYIDFMRFM